VQARETPFCHVCVIRPSASQEDSRAIAWTIWDAIKPHRCRARVAMPRYGENKSKGRRL
jgi:hypothetical protein